MVPGVLNKPPTETAVADLCNPMLITGPRTADGQRTTATAQDISKCDLSWFDLHCVETAALVGRVSKWATTKAVAFGPQEYNGE